MKKLFKTLMSGGTTIKQTPLVTAKPEKSEKEIIEEIHHSFYSEADKLLAEAKITNSLETTKAGLIEKCKRLRSLGFGQTTEIKEAEAEISRLEALKKENESKNSLAETINYFSFKYPNYKFITEDSVKKICEKYNLVYGSVSKYTGTVPDANLRQMEKFKISEEDECYELTRVYRGTTGNTM